jgi:hypothetical protein
VVVDGRVESERSALPGARRSWLDLGLRARIAFAVAYVAVMVAVVVSAQFRPDHVFGFQMFNESSTVNIHLFRRVRGRHGLEPLPGGEFRDRDGARMHRFRWRDRVHDPVLGHLDVVQHAKYGLAGQLFRLELALDDFVSGLPRDALTTALVARVETLKNGRDPEIVQLEAVRR